MGPQTAKTTERSLAVVNTIQSLGGATLTELVSELEMARSTAHVHLRTLVEHGYLEKEGEVYHVGLRFLNHGEYARSRKSAYRLAKETVENLSERTDEEVEFVVRNDDRGILVHESFHPDSRFPSKESYVPHATTSAGIYYYLHSVATGKAILAELSEDRLESVIDEWGLPEQTDRTITSQSTLQSELADVRERGVAFADGEYVEGLREVGRRVKAPDGSVIGAIAIIGPAYRFTDDRFTEKLPAMLTDAVEDLETEIESRYIEDYR